MAQAVFRDCRASVRGDAFQIENSLVRRQFRHENGLFRTVSLLDKTTGRELAVPERDTHDFSYVGLFSDMDGGVVPLELQHSACRVETGGVLTSDHLVLDFLLHDPKQEVSIRREYVVYPDTAVIVVKTAIRSMVKPNYYARMNFPAYPVREKPDSDFVDSLACADRVAMARCVSLFGITDLTNELVREDNVQLGEDCARHARGNLLFLKLHGHESGIFLGQEAPPSGEKIGAEGFDFLVKTDGAGILNWGLRPGDIRPVERPAYTSFVGVFQGDFENAAVGLKRYLAVRFPGGSSQRRTTVNPWGGGGEIWHRQLGNGFLREEIEATAEMGLEVYQIDDGWQESRNLAEMVNRNRSMVSADWQIRRDLFPDGFRDVAATGARSGVDLGLWFAPSFNKDYSDWEEQATLLYELYRQYGIKSFKIDGVVLASPEAEFNLRQLLGDLRLRTSGDIAFDLDTTSGRRPGYLSFQEFGNVFLENRYQNEAGSRRYEPWRTLRNLWMLSKYVPAQRLQIEFPDIGRAAEFKHNYRDSDYPEKFTQEYLAALSLFASPLCWGFPSKFNAPERRSVKVIMELHKSIRDRLWRSVVVPVGGEPSGHSWTGFQAHNFGTMSGLVLLFREQTGNGQHSFTLPFMEIGEFRWETLYGEPGDHFAHGPGNDTLTVTMSRPNSFLLLQYGRAQSGPDLLTPTPNPQPQPKPTMMNAKYSERRAIWAAIAAASIFATHAICADGRNLLYNGDFEEGAPGLLGDLGLPDGWVRHSGDLNIISLAEEPRDGSSGKLALKIAGNDESPAGGLRSDFIQIDPSKTLYIRGWVYPDLTAAGDARPKIMVAWYDEYHEPIIVRPDTTVNYVYLQKPYEGGWQEMDFRIDPVGESGENHPFGIPDNAAFCQIQLFTLQYPGVVIFDDFEVFQAE